MARRTLGQTAPHRLRLTPHQGPLRHAHRPTAHGNQPQQAARKQLDKTIESPIGLGRAD